MIHIILNYLIIFLFRTLTFCQRYSIVLISLCQYIRIIVIYKLILSNFIFQILTGNFNHLFMMLSQLFNFLLVVINLNSIINTFKRSIVLSYLLIILSCFIIFKKYIYFQILKIIVKLFESNIVDIIK